MEIQLASIHMHHSVGCGHPVRIHASKGRRQSNFLLRSKRCRSTRLASSNKQERSACMKAVVIDGPGQVQLKEVAEPAPGAEDVLIRARAAGICGSDVE